MNTNTNALAAVQTLIDEKTALEEKIADLVAYLSSDKFAHPIGSGRRSRSRCGLAR